MRNFGNLVNGSSNTVRNKAVSGRVVTKLPLNNLQGNQFVSQEPLIHAATAQEDETVFKWEHRNICYNTPVMTVGIIDHDMKEKIWMALESLKGQSNVVFPWELIVVEESGYSRNIVVDYVDKLPGCVRIVFKTILPGSGHFASSVLRSNGIQEIYTCMEKLRDVMKLADKGSNIFVKQGADCFSPRNRLYNHFVHFRDSMCLASTQLKGYVYDVANENIAQYDGTKVEPYVWNQKIADLIGPARAAYDDPRVAIRSIHLNTAYRLSAIRNIPLFRRPLKEKELDDTIFIGMFVSMNKRPEEVPIVRHDLELDDTGWTSGISFAKPDMLEDDRCLSYVPSEETINVPKDVVDRLNAMRYKDQMETLRDKQKQVDILEKRIEGEKQLLVANQEAQKEIQRQQQALKEALVQRREQEANIIKLNESIRRELLEESREIKQRAIDLKKVESRLSRYTEEENKLIHKKRQDIKALQQKRRILENITEQYSLDEVSASESTSREPDFSEEIAEIERRIADVERRSKEYLDALQRERDKEEKAVLQEKRLLHEKLRRTSDRMDQNKHRLQQRKRDQEEIDRQMIKNYKINEEKTKLEKALNIRVEKEQRQLDYKKEKIKQQQLAMFSLPNADITAAKPTIEAEIETNQNRIIDDLILKENKSTNNTKVGVVITTCAFWGVLARQCIECYRRELPEAYIVLFINGSDDEITLGLKDEFPDIEVIYIHDQIESGGLTGTWNAGIDMCIEAGCSAIILSNDDILFDACINNVVQAALTTPLTELSYYGPLTNNPGPAECNKLQYHIRPKRQDNFLLRYNNDYSNLNGFLMVFPKHVLIANKFDETYYFDPSYPFGGNETEWFNRFVKIGGRPIVVPQTFVYHYKIARWRKNHKINNVCAYTVNTGGYEGDSMLISNDAGLECLYFTDNWDLIYGCIEKGILPFYIDTFGKEAKLVQRTIKAAPHRYLPHNYDVSVYIDGNMRFITDPNYAYLKAVPGRGTPRVKTRLATPRTDFFSGKLDNLDTDVVHFLHNTSGHTVHEECNLIVKIGLETHKNINKLRDLFERDGFDDTSCMCSESGVLIRKHKNIKEFSEDWVKLINICRRDQASFDYLLWLHGVSRTQLPSIDRPVALSDHKNPRNRIVC